MVTPGSSLELPCLPALTELTTAHKTWTFNGNSCQDPFQYFLSNYIVLIFNFFFKNIGRDISTEASGSVRIKKDGWDLSISPISTAHQGQYMCLVNETSMDIRSTYDITVTGGKHAVMCIFFIVHILAKFERAALAELSGACGVTSNKHLAFAFIFL